MPRAMDEAPPQRTLVWVDRKGKEEPLPAPPKYYRMPKISPDGTKVALGMWTDGNEDIWIWDLNRETISRLTFQKESDIQPIWSPDGKRIVFMSLREGKYGIYWKAADGTGDVEKLGSAPDKNLVPWSWSSDGKALITAEVDASWAKSDIGTLSMDGDHTRKLLLKEEWMEGHPAISRDGQYMAYMSNESGQMEIHVRPFPEVDKGKWQISSGGGESPLWSPDGRELFYRNGDAVMGVPVNTKSTFSAGKPGILFRGPYWTGISESPAWDISPDGKRFLMMMRLQAPAGPRRINIVLNWTEELKQRVPVK
jgi:Tol biopolymer transport system component